MSDELVISGGGSIAVATDELLHHADSLRRISLETGSLLMQLAHVDRVVDRSSLHAVDAPLSSDEAENHIDKARSVLESITEEAKLLASGLMSSAARYGETERSQASLIQQLSARFGYAVGLLGPLLLVLLAPFIQSLATGIVFSQVFQGRPGERFHDDPSAWLREHNELITNPFTVALVRSLVMSSDDFVAGWAGVTPELHQLLGDEGLGIAGPDTSAAMLILLGSAFGVLGESPVRTTTTASSAAARSPTGFGDRIDRIPDATAREDGAQIRIERYSIPGEEDRFEVYIAGTADFGVDSTGEPWDMTSNVHGMAGLLPGSYHAVAAAMAEAGVTADSPVVFNGYSQGGLVASLLASSGEYNTHGLVTVGSPSGQVQLPGNFPAVAIEHTDDIVPALGGTRIDPDVLVIERHLYAGREVDNDVAVPAHQLDRYRDTARLIDDAKSNAIRDTARELNQFTASATGVDTTWLAQRVGDTP